MDSLLVWCFRFTLQRLRNCSWKDKLMGSGRPAKHNTIALVCEQALRVGTTVCSHQSQRSVCQLRVLWRYTCLCTRILHFSNLLASLPSLPSRQHLRHFSTSQQGSPVKVSILKGSAYLSSSRSDRLGVFVELRESGSLFGRSSSMVSSAVSPCIRHMQRMLLDCVCFCFKFIGSQIVVFSSKDGRWVGKPGGCAS